MRGRNKAKRSIALGLMVCMVASVLPAVDLHAEEVATNTNTVVSDESY